MSEDDAGRVRIASALEATGAFEGPLDVDLGNLTACDASPLDPGAFPSSGGASATEAALERGRDVLQRLVADLFSLPSESDVNGRYVQLPPGTTPFPRVKPLPPQVNSTTQLYCAPGGPDRSNAMTPVSKDECIHAGMRMPTALVMVCV